MLLFVFLSIGSTVMAEEVSFKQTIFIKSNKAKLWEALTTPEWINRYYMVPVLKMGSSKNAIIEYGAKDQVMISGKILAFEKEKKLSHTFLFGPLHKGTGDDDATIVTYEITEQNGLLILSLTHSGFQSKNQTYHSVTGGWPYILSNLKTLLETGKTLTEE